MQKNGVNLKYLTVSCLLAISVSFNLAQASSAELPDQAVTNAAPHIPAHALLHATPFKTRIIESDTLTAYARALYVTLDGPDFHETPIGTPMDGVAQLILARSDATVGCSGTLLSSALSDSFVLTAAHCVTDDTGNNILISGNAIFEGNSATEIIEITGVDVHPDWNGDFIRGNDIAILTLSYAPSSEINRYDIDRNSRSDVGSISEKIGYGLTGTGKIDETIAFGTKRNGMNRYDDTADTMLSALGLRGGRDFVRDSVLQYDFDDGTDAHDAFGFFFGISDTGLGNDEVHSAPGDSGGPTIKDGLIQGVTSYGLSLSFNNGATSDTTPNIIDSSIGEFGGDTHVALYASWIDSITGGSGTTNDSGKTVKCNPRQQRLGNC